MKKETLVRFFKVNSKKTQPTHLPNIPEVEIYKKNKKETLVTFLQSKFQKNPSQTLTQCPGSRNLQKK